MRIPIIEEIPEKRLLIKDIKQYVIYLDRLSGDKVIVESVKLNKIDGEYYHALEASRYNRVTGAIERYWVHDNQLKEL